jgi:DNA-binding NarL/FixJ family response regulator
MRFSTQTSILFRNFDRLPIEATCPQNPFMAPPIRIFLLHRHSLVLDVLGDALGRRSQVEVVGKGRSIDEALWALAGESPDAEVILLDGQLSDPQQIGVLRLRHGLPKLKLVVHGLQENLEGLDHLEAGAHGCVPVEASLGELVEVIEKVQREGRYCSEDLAKLLVGRMKQSPVSSKVADKDAKDTKDTKDTKGAPVSHEGAVDEPEHSRSLPLQPLSAQQLETLHHLALQKSNKEIAESMNLKISTIKTNVHHVLAKLEASNRRSAVSRAFRLGLLDPKT